MATKRKLAKKRPAVKRAGKPRKNSGEMSAATERSLKAALAKLTKKATGRGMTAADVSKARAIGDRLKAAGKFYNPARSTKRKRPAAKKKNAGVGWHKVTRAENLADANLLIRRMSQLAKRDKSKAKFRAKKYPDGIFVEASGVANPGRFKARRRNPGNVEEEAAELYRDFHGEDPDVVIDVATPVYEHSTLSGLGILKALEIKAVNGSHMITIAGFKGAILARPPRKSDKPQLYIEGGDQSVNLADFGIKNAHEFEILGAVHEIVYHTNKTHLVPEDGGRGDYGHKFKTGRDGDRHVKIRDGRYPLAVYDVRNRRIQIAGGSYDIPEEGISG